MERVPAEQNSVSSRFLTRAEFHRLADVPPEAEWFANIDNANTRLAYPPSRIELTFQSGSMQPRVQIRYGGASRNDVGDFIRFAVIERPDELRQEAKSTRCLTSP